MNAVRRFFRLFQDSPTYGRDRANLISGLTIGTAGLVLNATILMLVLPLTLDGDSADISQITENVEFGQLLALILLGGAAALAAVLIPLRLVTVFMGPRIGRYFDQIVLSGISPLRFVIGKATSQNLYLLLILFLLLPYFVLSLTLGGVDLPTFLAGLFLVWQFCMTLALVTIWASLFVNEMLAAISVGALAIFLGGMGCIPYIGPSFIVTPMPALIHPLYVSLPFFDAYVTRDFVPVFLSCALGMSGVMTVSLLGIYLGPLYGIIRDNSTFGEVVYPGDSKKKRWFRLRQHIQRPSEIAFFYENRGDIFRRHEGFVRWGIGLLAIIVLSGGARLTFGFMLAGVLAPRPGGVAPWWVYEFHATNLMIHGFSLAAALFLFSRSKNTTFLKIPFIAGRKVEVSRLDTIAYFLFVVLSTAATVATPFLYEAFAGVAKGFTVFPDHVQSQIGQGRDFIRIAIEGTLIITICGVAWYAIHRIVCLGTWVRGAAAFGSAGLYFVLVFMAPMTFAILYFELPEWRNSETFSLWAPRLASISPIACIAILFDEMGSRFPVVAVSLFNGSLRTAALPFYVVHAVLLTLSAIVYRSKAASLKKSYLTPPSKGTA